ncbi:MAG: hypothetical protein KME12_25720 [Trichocoleus desertorum ATA4-8-CV12]|jgi:hypothetical protein|nr:hypothetical protein [Trichocoleus desertorum ATA4-8-CV12]
MASKTTKLHPQVAEPLAKQLQPKRMIGITSDKGGNGKSTVARALGDIVLRRGIPTRAFDCDRRNAQLHRHYNQAFLSTFDSDAGVSRIDLSVRGGADELLNSLESPTTQIVLIDFPAGGGELFERFEREIKLFDFLSEIGYQLTMVSVLSRVKDSINSLRTLMEYCGDRADHVVLKNCFFGEPERFSRFDHSKTKELVLQTGGVILNFPDLYDSTYDVLDDKNLTFSDALQPQSGLPMADRRRVKVFLDEAEAEFLKAAEFLGLV